MYIKHEVIVEIEHEGVGKVTGEGTHKEGDLAELKAIAEDWYDFDNWTIKEGEILEEAEDLGLEVDDDKEIIANIKDKISVEEFEKAEWPLEEVKQTAEEAFQIFSENVSTTLFSEESIKKS
ncbi:InlB B-repeat-containing protein [Natranaerobius trueperi]|uniref:InlB B-repeat-containing protein n=1 Tax=Natranaerobius trueperi TaxID=759412 RepID=UPI003B83143B